MRFCGAVKPKNYTRPSPMEHYGADVIQHTPFRCTNVAMAELAILRQKSFDCVSFPQLLGGEASCGILFIKCL